MLDDFHTVVGLRHVRLFLTMSICSMLCPLHFVSAVTLKGKVWGPTTIYLPSRASHCMVSAYFFRISWFWWRKCRNHFQPATLSPLQCDSFFYTCVVPYRILFWMQIVHIPLCSRKGTGERVHKLQRLFVDISKWKVKQLGYQSWTKEDTVHPLKEEFVIGLQVRKPSPWEFHQYHERPYPKLVATLHAIIVLWPFKVTSVVCHM